MDARFHSTRWSIVAAAGSWSPERQDAEAGAALGELARIYWPPLFAFARRRGAGRDEASDLVQGFFARLVEKGGLEAEPCERARFRSFLVTAFARFCSNQRAHGEALKRGGGQRVLALETTAVAREDADLQVRIEVGDPETPERAFERRWALAVMQSALAHLEDESEAAGKGRLFAALRPHLSPGAATAPHAEVARELGLGEGALKVALHRLRRRYGELVREEVAGTLADPAQVEAELTDLIAALGRV